MSRTAASTGVIKDGAITLEKLSTLTRTFLVPTGAVLPFAMNRAPDGWLICDGQPVNRSQYPELFSEIGTIYGVGNGSTTFNVPDLRGEFVRGHARAKPSHPDILRAFGTLQLDAYRSHAHTASTAFAGNHNHGADMGTAGRHLHIIPGWWWHFHSVARSGSARREYGSTVWRTPFPNFTGLDGAHKHSVSVAFGGNHNHLVTVNADGSNETRPRNVAMLYCIKF